MKLPAHKTITRLVLQTLTTVVMLQMSHSLKSTRSIRISYKQFSNALTKNGFPQPHKEQHKGFLRAVNFANINSRTECAMFLAQLIHESGGLQFKEELAYKDAASDPYKSPLDLPGKRYFGRGYIQLTWAENYKKASIGIFGDDRLLKDPGLVSKDESVAFLTAGWYWKTRVGNIKGVKAGKFGKSTRAINGAVECNGKHIDKSKTRFQYYRMIFGIFGASGTPDEKGCYN